MHNVLVCSLRRIRWCMLVCVGVGLTSSLWLLSVAKDPRQVTRDTLMRLGGLGSLTFTSSFVISSDDNVAKVKVTLNQVTLNNGTLHVKLSASSLSKHKNESHGLEFRNNSSVDHKGTNISSHVASNRTVTFKTKKVGREHNSKSVRIIQAKKKAPRRKNIIKESRVSNKTTSRSQRKISKREEKQKKPEKYKSPPQLKSSSNKTIDFKAKKENEGRKTNITKGKELDSLFAGIDPDWRFNHTSLADLRRQLAKLHTAKDFTLTKQNAPLNSYIRYATLRGVYKVTQGLHDKLPKKQPDFQTKHFRSCSIVGSSGILTGSGCGKQIDSAEFVVRFNLSPLGPEYTPDVGRKVDLITCNRYRLKTQFEYAMTEANKKKFLDFLSYSYPELSHMWLFPFSVALGTVDNVRHVADVLKEYNSSVQAVFSNPRHMYDTKVFWEERGVNAKSLSSGMNLITLALEVCEELHVYGFWPWLIDRRGQEVKYHYEDVGKYGGGGLGNPNHSMPDEFSVLLQLYKQGVLRLVTTPC